MAGIYIHIPFCKKRCIYCDFFSTTQGEKKRMYVDALCKELSLRKDYLKGEQIGTIYFGGGTPSQLSEEELRALLETIFRLFPVKEDAEITFEANPDDLSVDYLQVLRTLPINRISMGVQTFNDRKLQMLNRRHTAQQAYEAVLRCQQAGFTNISIDLIYGLPGESMEEWKNDLATAFSLPISHLSAYHLMYEPGTPLWNLWEKHQIHAIDEELSTAFFEELIRKTREVGFEQYEISNFSLPGFHSRHNSSYWSGVPYLGCGASAHSYDGVSRQWNIANLDAYIQGVSAGTLSYEREDLDLGTRYNEYVMTHLRTAKGFSPSQLQKLFGDQLYKYAMEIAEKHLKTNHLEWKDDAIKLSHQGIFISDGIMSDFMWISEED